RIARITPQLLVEQAKARAAKVEARAKDPLAATAKGYEYRIAPYDILSVTVWEHPELTIPAGEFREAALSGNPVNADGNMFYPHVGVIHVAGLTVPEVRTILTDRLRRVINAPQLDVRVVGFRGKRVQVTGEVAQPATLPITDVPLRVQDAIAQVRGLTPEAWPRQVTLTRGGTVYALDLQALYEEGDVSQNWLLQDGDILNVPNRQQNKVFVLGEVRQPLSRTMVKGRMSLAEAIADSAGFDQLTSNPGGVYVFRGSYDQPGVFHLDASSADALLLATQFQLEPLDVVYVTPYKLTSWNRVVQQILPTIQGVWQSVDLANRGVNVIQGE
ncbi:MAG TPA: polysaccharide export protein, partial [Anaeromyxobacteraceae bacterium]|nr:polysaccharide export protein [Anaeromyxobacteraceae bacterium]